MKNYYLTYLFLFFCVALSAQTISFTDRNASIALLNHNPIIDTDNNGRITRAEASDFTGTLDLDAKNISSFDEIRFFSNVKTLFLRQNLLTSIDLSLNDNLEKFFLNECNNLSNLVLSSDASYTLISASDCNLSSFSIGDNPSIISSINLTGNPLTSVSFGNIPEVTVLNLHEGELTEFDTGEIKKINIIRLQENSLENAVFCRLEGVVGQSPSINLKNQNGKEPRVYRIGPNLPITVSVNQPFERLEDGDCDGVSIIFDCDDNDPANTNNNQFDNDCDGVLNGDDNCVRKANPDQADTDNDGQGDACDTDIDGDGVLNGDDNCPLTPNPDQTDTDSDGQGDVCESSFSDANSFLSAPDALGDISGDTGTLKITIRDSDGNPINNVRVRFVLNSGIANIQASDGRTDADGKYSTTVTSNTPGKAFFRCRVDSDGNNSFDLFVSNGSPTGITFVENSTSYGGGAVGINTTEPDASSILDVNSSNKGILFPRVSLLSSSDKTTIINPAVSLLVYNTNSSASLDVGFVYFDGNKWINFK